MPSSPRSSLELFGSEFRRPEMSMNVGAVDAFAVLVKERTCPVFCTTYQRVPLAGACSSAMGCVKLGRLEKTRCVATDTVELGGSPARQVGVHGPAARPPPRVR